MVIVSFFEVSRLIWGLGTHILGQNPFIMLLTFFCFLTQIRNKSQAVKVAFLYFYITLCLCPKDPVLPNLMFIVADQIIFFSHRATLLDEI